jgi:hypothetical protein
MKIWKILLLSILCCGALGGWYLIGCGSSDSSICEDACNKISNCGALWVTGTGNVDDCKNKCLGNIPQVDCILDCGTGTSCDDYGSCVLHSCNPPQS